VKLVGSGVPPRILIGRGVPPEGLSLPWDPDASRTHASLTERDGAWWLEDAGSRNGTFIGEFAGSTRLTAPVRLAPLRVFRVGLTRLRIEPSESVEAVAEASATAAHGGTR
jgi:hypothetical protein